MGMVYLDYNATTPMAEEVVDAMLPYLRGGYGNPSSIHAEGRLARAAIDDARDALAAILGARPHEIIFTSGGTESCNLAVLGIARAHAPKGKHLITSPTEHHAVLHAFEYLQHHEGYEVTLLPVDGSGLIDPEELSKALRRDTTLVSIMHANNETGVIQPVAEMAALCRENGTFFHTDAVQSFGKTTIPVLNGGISAMSLAAHKFYGPKGAGVLWLKAGIALSRVAHGGSHENTRRPGTENVAAIVGTAAAARLAEKRRLEDEGQIARLRDELWGGIFAIHPAARRNGAVENSLGNTLNVSFPGFDGEALLIALDLEGVGVSSGSACMVGSMQPSHVLTAMGVDQKTAASTVRFSLGHGTTETDVKHSLLGIKRVLERQGALATV